MKLKPLYLPVLLSGTLLLAGCGGAAEEQGASSEMPDSQQQDVTIGSNTASDNDATVNDSSGSDSEAGTGANSGSGSTTDSGSNTNPGSGTGNEADSHSDTDTDTDTDTDSSTGTNTNTEQSQEDAILLPAQAAIFNTNDQLSLSGSNVTLALSWQKKQGNNGAFWQVLIDGQSKSAFMAIGPASDSTNGNMQSGSQNITFTKEGQHLLQVQLCPQARASEYCSISAAFRVTVTSDASQYQSNLGESLYSAWNNQLCLTNKNNSVTLVQCADDVSQKWLLKNQQVQSAQDTRLCMDAKSLTSGAAVTLKTCNSDNTQKWQLSDNAIRNHTWALDVNTSNQQVIIWSHHGNINQQWRTQQQIENKPETGDVIDNSQISWTSVDVLPTGNYGSYEFSVPAAQNWVNSGLFLRKGQSAQISGSGLWSVTGGDLYDANGDLSEESRGCQLGELVARLGLYYKDPAITCIGRAGTIIAHEDGILYVGAVVSNDLGETYEARKNALGTLTVTIVSEGDVVPTIDYELAPYFNYSQVKSGWVEIRSQHNILTLPIATAIKDAAKLTLATQRLDDIYQQHESLRGKTPYHGQPIRWFADTKDAPGWMLAGNPVRMDPALVDVNSSSRITLAAELGNNDWGFAHELGHNFNFAGGDWYYTTYSGLEAWPNIFSLHAIEQLGLPPRDISDCDQKKSEYLAKGVHENGLGGAWTGLCFLSEFTEQYGWHIWKNFYQTFNVQPSHGWGFLRDRLSEAAGEDVTPIFNDWNIPLN
mgnify:CR=1 FL=1